MILNATIPRNNAIKRAIVEKGYKLTGNGLNPILSLVHEITGEQLTLNSVGGLK